MPVDLFELAEEEVYEQITTVLERLKALRDQGKIKLSKELDTMTTTEIVQDGLKNLNIYHLRRPLYIKNGMFRSEDIKVLYFYANRLSGYDLDRFIHNRAKEVQSLKMTVDLL
jgi:glycerol-3-phosphate O-acyltransferase